MNRLPTVDAEDADEEIDQVLLAEIEMAIASGETDVDAPIPYVITPLGLRALIEVGP